MENRADYIDDLIGKCVAGEATTDEQAIVEAWEKSSEVNKQYVADVKLIFTRAASATTYQAYDTDKAWSTLKLRLITQPKGKSVVMPPRQYSFGNALRMAASIILVLGVGYFAYTFLSPPSQKPFQLVAEATVIAEVLPEGSEVFLNKGTTLEYTFNPKTKTHEVALAGEAYFAIKHDAKKEFVIHVAGVYIKDIGTSFNVKAYPENNTIEVVVEEGEVMLYTETDSGIYLSANGKGVYDKSTKMFSIDQPEANVTAYKSRHFIFSHTTLGEIADALNHVYDKRVVVPTALRECQVTASFYNEDISEIVDIIAETLSLNVKTTANEFILEGTGCVTE